MQPELLKRASLELLLRGPGWQGRMRGVATGSIFPGFPAGSSLRYVLTYLHAIDATVQGWAEATAITARA